MGDIPGKQQHDFELVQLSGTTVSPAVLEDIRGQIRRVSPDFLDHTADMPGTRGVKWIILRDTVDPHTGGLRGGKRQVSHLEDGQGSKRICVIENTPYQPSPSGHVESGPAEYDGPSRMAAYTSGDHPRGNGVHAKTRTSGIGRTTGHDSGRDVARLACFSNRIMHLSLNATRTQSAPQMAARMRQDNPGKGTPRRDSLLNEYFAHFLELGHGQWHREEDELIRSIDARYGSQSECRIPTVRQYDAFKPSPQSQ